MTLLPIYLTDTLSSSDSGNKRPFFRGMAATMSNAPLLHFGRALARPAAANYITASLVQRLRICRVLEIAVGET